MYSIALQCNYKQYLHMINIDVSLGRRRAQFQYRWLERNLKEDVFLLYDSASAGIDLNHVAVNLLQ